MSKNYFIKKSGLYYRPNSSGYTEWTHRAGLYTKEEAEACEKQTHGDCEAVKVSDVANIDELIDIRDHLDDVIRAALERKRQ